MSREHELQARLDLAVEAGREAGQITLNYFNRGNYEVEWKADHSPVTVADRQAEEHLRARIEDRFPDDGILGEEFEEKFGTSGYRWILDPIDGTKSFVSGVPLYGTMVAVEHDRRGVVGVVDLPPLDECVYAAVGQGVWLLRGGQEPQPARVSACRQLDQALFCATSVESFYTLGRQAAFERLMAETRLTRTWGDCYGYLLVATGRAEVMIDPAMNVWDAAALQPIMEEAGGTFTDWRGEATIHHHEAIATNGHLLEAVLDCTRGK
jgi:histidinol phosphatase-like enzyme (inositol monophosphatase family)